MLQRTYRVEFETDPTTKQVTAKLPTLNHTADFGDTAEKALSNLRELATGLIEFLLDEGKEIPPSDTTEKGGVFLSLSLNLKPRPRVKRAKKYDGCAIAATQRQRGSTKTQKSRV
jgi:predicted RNase H-like HicB family nuclease